MNMDLRQGDSLDILKTIPENSVDTMVTSPPYYNAREYSQYGSLEEYMQQMKSIFVEL